MEIILGKTAGFCYGVKRSVEEAKKYMKEKGKTDCLGELIHNEEALKLLQEQGMRVIENIEEADKRVIFRAHGIEKEVYEKAKQGGIEVKDLTCPKVLKIHKMAEEYAQKRKIYYFNRRETTSRSSCNL